MVERLQPAQADQESSKCRHDAWTHRSHRHLRLLRAAGFLLASAPRLTAPLVCPCDPEKGRPKLILLCLHPGLACDWPPLPGRLRPSGLGVPFPWHPSLGPRVTSARQLSSPKAQLQGPLLPPHPLQVLPASWMPRHHGLPQPCPCPQPSTLAAAFRVWLGPRASLSSGPGLLLRISAYPWLPPWVSTFTQFAKVA